ncbi:MAG: DUF365 domain-containing protein [archaeon]|jgi:hypothetical protein
MVECLYSGVIYSIPKTIIERILARKRCVFVKYSSHQLKKRSKISIKPGMRIYLYASGSGKLVLGDAKINRLDYLDYKSTLSKYKGRLMFSEKEFMDYAKGRETKTALILEISQITRYSTPLRLKKPINMGGLLIKDLKSHLL